MLGQEDKEEEKEYDKTVRSPVRSPQDHLIHSQGKRRGVMAPDGVQPERVYLQRRIAIKFKLNPLSHLCSHVQSYRHI